LLVVGAAVVVLAIVAGFVLMSSDDDPPANAFTDACSIVDNAAITGAVAYPVQPGIVVSTPPPTSGCTFATADPSQPPIGVIVTDDLQNAESFDRDVLEASFDSIESVRGLGDKATFLSREGAAGPDSTDALLVITDGNEGVEISVNGLVSPNRAFDLAQSVGELYADELGFG
jgi:hypothetical protein